MAKKRGLKQKRDWAERCVELWIGLFVALYLLFPGFKGYTAISGAKTLLFYILSALLLMLGLTLLLRDLRQKRRLRPGPAQIAALVFLGCTLVSAACSELSRGNPWYDPNAHEAALTVACYVLLFLILSRWGLVTERLFWVLFWSLTCFCALCLLQMLGKNPLGLYPGSLNFYDEVYVKRTYAGTVGNVDIVSAFLTLAAPMLLLHTRGQGPKQAWPCWLLAAVCLAVMLWIDVLCGLAGLALGGAVCLAVLCPAAKRKWILLGLGGLALLGVAALWLLDLPVGFLHELHEMLHGRFEDSYGTGRVYIWRQMLARIPKRLWTGVGPDMARYSGLRGFVTPVSEMKQAALADSPISLWIPQVYYRKATLTDGHCYPLHILYCQGLPALLSWLTVTGTVLVHWFRTRRDRAAAILGGGLACFLCAMLFCISSIIVMPFFWITMGLIEARYKKVISNKE